MLRTSLRSVLAVGVYALLLAWQVLLPGYIGLANNGDFSKIAGRLCLGGIDDGADNFIYFVADYIRRPQDCWDSGLPSSELFLAGKASQIERALSDHERFNIRWLGAIHAAGFLLAFALWLQLIEPL